MLRRLVPLLVLIALVVAPFGRVAAAEAMTSVHAAATMAGHCDEGAAPAHHPSDNKGEPAIDCLIACAALAVEQSQQMAAVAVLAPARARFAAAPIAGRNPEADPPPPRRS